jgi:Galactose oxidase, central domain/Kelch motif
VFDPARQTFAPMRNMNVSRVGHTATLLPNGKVLIAGGYNGDYLASAELYDPAAHTFSPTNTMVTARSGHMAVLLRNGKVLLAGGVGLGWTFLSNAELYDPATNSFTPTGDMINARESHTATLLANGRRDGRPAYSSAEIYNPATGTFAAAGDMNSPRYKLQGTVVLLNNGKVLIAGGANRAEVFDPSKNRFSYVQGDMGTSRLFAAATRLRNGKVLITGGYHGENQVSAQAWLFRS